MLAATRGRFPIVASGPAGRADLAAAAEIEIDRLSRYDGRHPGPRKLGELFQELRGYLGMRYVNRAAQ